MLYHMEYLKGGVRGQKGAKPNCPLMCLFLNKRSSYAHQQDLLRYDRLPKLFTSRFCRQIKGLGFIPKTIIGSSMIACRLLKPIVAQMDIMLEYDPHRAEFSEFSEAMQNWRP